MLFIDGDHNYAGVKKDYLMYRDLVRSGGLIIFHDIVADHGVRFDRPRTHYTPWGGGVYYLWQQVKAHFKHFEFIDDPEQDGFGIGVIVHEPGHLNPGDLALPDGFTVKE